MALTQEGGRRKVGYFVLPSESTINSVRSLPLGEQVDITGAKICGCAACVGRGNETAAKYPGLTVPDTRAAKDIFTFIRDVTSDIRDINKPEIIR